MLVKGEHFPRLADHVLTYYNKDFSDGKSIRDGQIVYCDTHQLNKWKDVLIQKKDLIIITHNSDGFITGCNPPWREDGVYWKDFEGCFKAWFAQNNFADAPNIYSIPIGFENTRWDKNKIKQHTYKKVLENTIPNPTKVAYLNCAKRTNEGERQRCYDEASQMPFINCDEPNLTYGDYINRLQDHSFGLSPEGNGLDCHRTWEIFLVGRTPIMKFKPALYKLYGDDVIWVESWKDITKEILNKYKGTFNRKKLTQQYWDNYIKGEHNYEI
jgi:hypothetical protein